MDDPEEASSIPNESLSTKDLMSGEMPSQTLVDNEEKDIAPSLTVSYISDKGDDLSSAANSVKDALKQKQREERLRQNKEQLELEKQKKLLDFLDAQRRAEEQRKKHDEEKKRKLELSRKKESERHLTVEERRQKLETEERERKLAVLRKYAEKNAKLMELRSSSRSSTQGVYAFGSRTSSTARSVTSNGFSIDSSRRVVSHATLHDHTAAAEPSLALATPKPGGVDRSRASSACNLSARGFSSNNPQTHSLDVVEEVPNDSEQSRRSRPSTVVSARDVRHSPASSSSPSTHLSRTAIITSPLPLSSHPGVNTSAVAGGHRTDRYSPYETRQRRPHSAVGRLPSYASPTVASQIREGRDRKKQHGEGVCGAMCSRFRSASVAPTSRRGRETEPRDRSAIASSIDRLATPKHYSIQSAAADTSADSDGQVKRTPGRSPSVKQAAASLKTAASDSKPSSSSPVPNVPKPGGKLAKPPAPTAAKITATKGPVRAVHSNPKNEKSVVSEDSTVTCDNEAGRDAVKADDVAAAMSSSTDSSLPGDISTSVSAANGLTHDDTPSRQPNGKEATKTHSRTSVTKEKTTLPDHDDAGSKCPSQAASVEDEYKAKLAEKRRLAREKAEQEAAEAKRIAEEKRREEEEQQRREEEEQQRREEEEVALAEEARLAEEERLRLAQEAEELKRKQEVERRAAEQKAKEEAQRKAQEEKERADKEREERSQKEEQERQNRKKRLDDIMKRVVKTEDGAADEAKADVMTSSSSSLSMSTSFNEQLQLQAVNTGGGGEGQFKSPLLQQLMTGKSRSSGLQLSSSPGSVSPQRLAENVDSDVTSAASISNSMMATSTSPPLPNDPYPPTCMPENNLTGAKDTIAHNTAEGLVVSVDEDNASLQEYDSHSCESNTNAKASDSDSGPPPIDDSSFLSCLPFDSSSCVNLDDKEPISHLSNQHANGNGVHSAARLPRDNSSDADFRSPRRDEDGDIEQVNNGDAEQGLMDSDCNFEQVISVPDSSMTSKLVTRASPIPTAFEPNSN